MKVFLKIFVLIIFSQLLGFIVIAYLSGIPIANFKDLDTDSSLEIIKTMGLYNYVFISQLTTVLIPAIIFLFIYRRNTLVANIGLLLPKRNSYFIYAIFLLFLSYPLIQLSADLNSKMFFADWMQKESQLINKITLEFLKMDNFRELLRNIFLIALLPAIGEELFFRAGIQKELVKYFKQKDFAIILAAAIFSAFHLEFDGFLPRFFLGLILGYVYFWSSSLWVSIIVHFINNSMLIVSAYFIKTNLEELITSKPVEAIPIYMLLMSLVAVFVIRHKMHQMYNEDNLIVEKNIENKDFVDD